MMQAVKENWWYIPSDPDPGDPDPPVEPVVVLGWRPIQPYCIVETDPGYSTCQGIDLAIILDITGSMENSLNNIRQSLSSIIASISNKYGDYRLSLSIVTDDYSAGLGNSYYEILEPFALGNQAAVQVALDSITLANGGENPEPHDLALQAVLNGLAGSFRDKVTKAVFIITDAPNSGYNDAHGSSDITFAQSLSQKAEDKGIMLFPVIVGGGSEATAVGNAYVGNTGGALYTTSSNGNVDSQIIDALGDVQCIIEPPKSGRTGYQGYSKLEQYNVDTGFATGVVKNNSPGDPDYFYPEYNPDFCPVFTINPIERYASYDYTSFNIEVKSNSAWSIISKPVWVQVSPVSGTGNANVLVMVAEHKNQYERSGFITFSSDGLTKTCKVIQSEDLLPL